MLTHERLRKANGKCLRNWRQSVAFKMRYIMQLSFLRLLVSSVLVFFVFYDFDILLCVNVRVVAPPKTTVTVRKTREIQLFSNWDLPCKSVFWGSVFQVFSASTGTVAAVHLRVRVCIHGCGCASTGAGEWLRKEYVGFLLRPTAVKDFMLVCKAHCVRTCNVNLLCIVLIWDRSQWNCIVR